MLNKSHSNALRALVAVIGAGLSGLILALALRRLGLARLDLGDVEERRDG